MTRRTEELLRRTRPLRSLTVSYIRTDIPLATSRAGYGETYADALRDADSQLADGTWKRLVVSNPHTIMHDLEPWKHSQYARRFARNAEGVVIRIEKRISEVVEVE